MTVRLRAVTDATLADNIIGTHSTSPTVSKQHDEP
jgi:hypothetical protein